MPATAVDEELSKQQSAAAPPLRVSSLDTLSLALFASARAVQECAASAQACAQEGGPAEGGAEAAQRASSRLAVLQAKLASVCSQVAAAVARPDGSAAATDVVLTGAALNYASALLDELVKWLVLCLEVSYAMSSFDGTWCQQADIGGKGSTSTITIGRTINDVPRCIKAS